MSLAVSDPLKNNLEETVAREFLLATGSPYKVLRAGLPPEPDQLCEHRTTGRQVGIEVVSVYYDQNHAKSVWIQAREKKTLSYAISRKDSVENVRLLAESLRRIRVKSRKRYSVNGHLVLVVFTYPHRLYLCNVGKRLTTLRLPSHHPFDEICIMSQHGEVYRLFPNNSWLLR
jgi:hypothetical protein